MSHETRIISQKTNKKNYKTQFPTNKILNDGFEKKKIGKNNNKNNEDKI